jgi:GNAT superfamily N-acetyltransferase
VSEATVLAFQRETLSRAADRVEHHPLGYVLVTPSLEAVWSLNALVVERPPPGLTLDGLDAALDEHLAGGRYASAVLHDDALAERLAPEAAERGWKVEREVVMELRREPDRVVDTSGVREATKDEVMALMSSWFAEEHAEHGEETLRQLDEYAEREWRSRPPRAFVTGDGVATCKLRSDGTTAQVEDVYTAPAARGRGHARALLTHAVAVAREAGHEPIFIVADDDGTPKELYARLGFDPLLRATRLVRERR